MPHLHHDISNQNPVCRHCGVTVARLVDTHPFPPPCPAPTSFPWPLVGAR